MSTPSTSVSHSTDQAEPERESELQQIRDALHGLRFGSVQIIVQDGVVVQIDRTEKRRIQRRGGNNSACN